MKSVEVASSIQMMRGLPGAITLQQIKRLSGKLSTAPSDTTQPDASMASVQGGIWQSTTYSAWPRSAR